MSKEIENAQEYWLRKLLRRWNRKLTASFINPTLSREKLDQESLEIINNFTQTWRLLHLYDENKLGLPTTISETSVELDYQTAIYAIAELKKNLISKNEASMLFGKEKDKQLQGILGDIHQTFGNTFLYPSCEERAAHLLYFVIKNHPFVDGNKRIGSFLFVRYLRENNFDASLINDGTLTMLALHIASSQPNEKDSMIKLIVNLITKY